MRSAVSSSRIENDCNIHTSRPLGCTGIYDQSASADMLLAQPPLYAVGREAQLYRSHSFWVNIIDALYQSTVIFFVAYCVRCIVKSLSSINFGFNRACVFRLVCVALSRLTTTRQLICGNSVHWWRRRAYLWCWYTSHRNSDHGYEQPEAFVLHNWLLLLIMLCLTCLFLLFTRRHFIFWRCFCPFCCTWVSLSPTMRSALTVQDFQIRIGSCNIVWHLSFFGALLSSLALWLSYPGIV